MCVCVHVLICIVCSSLGLDVVFLQAGLAVGRGSVLWEVDAYCNEVIHFSINGKYIKNMENEILNIIKLSVPIPLKRFVLSPLLY